jgi:hypothetical protein
MNLHAIAATIPVPVDAMGTRARAYCTFDDLGYRVYFLLDGLRSSPPVGPGFRKPRQACALADLLNGEPVSSAVSAAKSPLPALSGAEQLSGYEDVNGSQRQDSLSSSQSRLFGLSPV